jgi:hypothetical protein
VNFDTSQPVMLLGDRDKQVAISGTARATGSVWRAIEALSYGLTPTD